MVVGRLVNPALKIHGKELAAEHMPMSKCFLGMEWRNWA
jgi:hypothetical protein